jgi:hypothetical protein
MSRLYESVVMPAELSSSESDDDAKEVDAPPTKLDSLKDVCMDDEGGYSGAATAATAGPATAVLRCNPFTDPDMFLDVGALGPVSTQTFRCMLPVTTPYGDGPRKCLVFPGWLLLLSPEFPDLSFSFCP